MSDWKERMAQKAEAERRHLLGEEQSKNLPPPLSPKDRAVQEVFAAWEELQVPQVLERVKREIWGGKGEIKHDHGGSGDAQATIRAIEEALRYPFRSGEVLRSTHLENFQSINRGKIKTHHPGEVIYPSGAGMSYGGGNRVDDLAGHPSRRRPPEPTIIKPYTSESEVIHSYGSLMLVRLRKSLGHESEGKRNTDFVVDFADADVQGGKFIDYHNPTIYYSSHPELGRLTSEADHYPGGVWKAQPIWSEPELELFTTTRSELEDAILEASARRSLAGSFPQDTK